MPSLVICHNYALSGVTWFDINDSDKGATSLPLCQREAMIVTDGAR